MASLTITAGTFNTNETDGANPRDLTVTGATSVTGTLTCNDSTVSLGSGLTSAYGLTVNTNGTFAGGSGSHTIGSIKVSNSAAAVCTLSTSTTVINSENDSDNRNINLAGTDSVFTSNGVCTMTFAGATRAYRLGGTLTFGGTLKINNASLAFTAAGPIQAATLTITAGTFDTGSDQALTVTGYAEIGPASGIADQATLTCNASAISLGSGNTSQYGIIINQGGTFAGGTGTHTLGGIKVADHAAAKFTCTSGNTTINGEHASDNYNVIVYDGATFDNADGKIILTGPSSIFYMQSSATVQAGEPRAHNLTINSAGNTFDLGHNLTVEGALIITAGTLDTTALSNRALTAILDETDIQAAGTLTGNASAISLKALTIRDGGTYNGTSGTTTITGEQGGYAWSNQETDGTGFVHNNGTVTITTPTTTVILERDSFYNLIINNGDNITQWDASLTCAGTLLVNAGDTFYADDAGNSLTVTGAVTVNGILGTSGRTGAYSFGSLTIAAAGTYSATSGTTTINGSFDNNGTDPTTSFIHNNGTILIEPQAASGIAIRGSDTGTGTVFYNVTTGASSNSNIVELVEKMVILNHLDANVKTRPSGEVRFGKADASTAAEGGSVNTGTSFQIFGGTLIGLSTIYPTVFTGGINYESSSAMRLSNLDWSAFSYTVGNNPTITLDGDMIFGALTINAGTTLDLNGQRAEFSGAFDLTTGALAMNDAMAVFNNTIDFNGRVPTSNTGTTIIHDPPSAGEKLITSLYFGGTFFAKGVESDVNGYAWGGSSGEYPAKIFVGGQLDCQQSVKTGHWQVATGGELRGNDRTLTAEGDFTMSGGLIGKSALTFDGTDDVASGDSAAGSTSNPTDNLFVEAWWKSTNNTPETSSVIGKEDSYLLYINGSGYLQGYVYGSSSDISISGGWMGSIFDQKWHHIAMGYSQAGGLKIWLDGRLIGHNTTNAGTFNQNANDIRVMRYASNYGQGTIAMGRIWSGAVPTNAQVRSNMFKGEADSPAYTSGVIQTAWYFDEGAGTTVEDVGAGTDADLTITGAAWAGAGAFVDGTSTVDMTGNGKTLCLNGDTEFYNLTVAGSGKTTNLYNPADVTSALYIASGGTLTHGGGTFQVSGGSSGYYPNVICRGTYSANADFEDLYTFYFVGQSVSNVQPAGTFNYLIYDNAYNGGTNYNVTLGGNITGSNYISVQDGCGLNTRSGGVDYDIISSRVILKNSASLTLNSSTLNLTNTVGLDLSTTTNTLSAGPGCVISGSSAGTTFKSQNNFAVVGKIENLNVTNEELKVTGEVINCTGDIHQYFPTIDHAQQLDADTADDRDVRLGRDLDKNTELINS